MGVSGSFTVRLKLMKVFPAVLVACIVYWVRVMLTIDAPQILPFVSPKERPFGRSGRIDQFTTSPPAETGTRTIMSIPRVNVTFSKEEEITGGWISKSTVMLTVAVEEPPVLTAVMVYMVSPRTETGVPVIWPLDESKFNPVERSGRMDHETIAPPELVGESTSMIELLVTVR